jgi:hypothetical protein
MKITLLMALCGVAILASGCAAGISRTGYHLPADQATKNLPRRPIAIRYEMHYSPNDVEVLGSIHAYDTGFSTDCDEAAILDIFCREGNMLDVDIINITEEKQPNPLTSTCYRARAEFLRFKDREKAKDLVSDPKYAPNLIIERSIATGKRNREVITGAVLGGLLGAIVVTAATDPNATNSGPTSVQGKQGHR